MPVKSHQIHHEKPVVTRLNVAELRRKKFILGLVILLLPLSTYFGTQFYIGEENERLSDQVERQESLVRSLAAEVEHLDQLKVNAELSSEVDRQSMEALRQEIVGMQQQNEVLQEQIQFYQSLMEPNPSNSGVYVHAFSVVPLDMKGAFMFETIVAQRSANHRRVAGRLFIELESSLNSESVQTLSHEQLTGSSAALPLGFKFFQSFQGTLNVPESFNPSSVKVVLRLDGIAQPIVTSFPWTGTN